MARNKWKPLPGARVTLLEDDTLHYDGIEPNPLPAGTEGTVLARCGTILGVQWDNGLTSNHNEADIRVTAKAG